VVQLFCEKILDFLCIKIKIFAQSNYIFSQNFAALFVRWTHVFLMKLMSVFIKFLMCFYLKMD